MSEATAGTLVGYLRLDASQWHDELRRAGIAADALGENSPDIDIDVNAEEAVARLRAVGDEAENTEKRTNESVSSMEKRFRAMVLVIGSLAPAIGPLAGAAVAAGVGLAGMGIAGVAAVAGIKREMEEGTPLGIAYSEAIGDAKDSLNDLTHTAALSFLGSFRQGVEDIDPHLRAITPLIQDMAGYLGQSGVNLLNAALTAFEAMEPLVRDVASWVHGLSEALAEGAGSDGFASFVDYLQGVLPSVLDMLAGLVGTVGNLVVAFAPLGGAVVSALGAVANAIAAIDPDVLQVVATAAGAAFLAFSAYRTLNSLPTLFQNIATGARSMGTGLGAAATGAQRFQAAMGIVGVAIAAATMVYTAFVDSQAEAATVTSDYTTALIDSNGALDENVRLVALKKAQDDGAIEAGKQLGLTTNDVVSAYLGEADAVAKVDEGFRAATEAQMAKVAAGQADASTVRDAQDPYLRFQALVNGSTDALAVAKVKQQQHTEVMGAAKTAQEGYSDAVYTATDYINDQKAAIEEWRDEVDKAILDTLDLEAAHDASTKKLGELTSSIKDNGKQFKGNTTEALANREAIRAYAASKVKEAEEVQKTTGSNVKANETIKAGRKALYDSMIQAGLTKDEAKRLTDKYLAIPKTIKTQIDLTSEAAQKRAETLKTILAEIRSKTITITVKQRLQNEAKLLQNGVNDYANGGITAYASGGITAFANGAENHVAQIAPAGAMRLWAEPETGGEAYIPLHPAKRDRSLAIWEETGKRLGALGNSSGDSAQVASALLALAAELRSLHSIPAAVERGMAQRARLERLDARARYSA